MLGTPMWTIDLPLTVPASAKKKLSLNLNAYRNWHYYEQDLTKKLFEKIATEKLKGIPKLEKVHLHYVLWAPTAQRRDLMNVIAIVDKYFSDALPKANVLDDDHAEIIVSISAAYGGIDRSNPRVTVTIVPVDSPMELNLR
jgi:Holliday junction resolvase RusA-like endonuclease